MNKEKLDKANAIYNDITGLKYKIEKLKPAIKLYKTDKVIDFKTIRNLIDDGYLDLKFSSSWLYDLFEEHLKHYKKQLGEKEAEFKKLN